MIIMNSEDIIVGVERTLEQVGDSWNKKQLRWIVTHHTPEHTLQHCIQLDITILSSERIVSVDGQVQLQLMCSFGLQCEFPVSSTITGSIRQDGLEFQLYLNGKSFTQCSKLNYNYQPPTLPIDSPQKNEFKPDRLKNTIKPSIPQKSGDSSLNFKGTKKEEEKKVEVREEKKEFPGSQPTEKSIKDMQNEALKILIQQKKERQKAKLK